jgi:hypothetical protein
MIRNKIIALALCAGLATLTFSVNAQDTAKPVTPDDVLTMMSVGLSDSIILAKIHQHNKPIDLSTDDLVRLKKAKVSDAVIRELIDPSTVPAAEAAPSTVVVQSPLIGNAGAPSGATPGAGDMAGDPGDPLSAHDSGIYIYTTGHDGKPLMTELERTAYQGAKTGGMFASAMTYGIAKAKSRAIIPGKAANMRVGDPLPVFYFYFDEKSAGLSSSSYFAGQNISNPNQFALIRLDSDKNSRSAEIGEFSMWGASSGNNQKDVVVFKSERLKPGLYKVTLSEPLKAGEYCFMAAPMATSSYAGVAGTTAGHDLFDFGVDK